jgi:hypothetical protein
LGWPSLRWRFSIDAHGPTIGALDGFGTGMVISEGDILSSPVPGPPIGMPGPGPFATAPGITLPAAALVIAPSPAGFREVDALSYGHDALQEDVIPRPRLFFSVDEFAVGIPGAPLPPNVTTEGAFGNQEASADVFVDVGLPPALPLRPFVPAGPLPAGAGNTAFLDGNGVAPTGRPGYALMEPNLFSFTSSADRGDNLDAVDVDTTPADVNGPIYFSLDSSFADPFEGGPPVMPNTGTALANQFVGGDVLVCPAPGAPPVLYAAAVVLGLDATRPDSDDLDALALMDNGDMRFTPGQDILLFSVRRGSSIIGTPDLLGAPIEAGDILIDAFTGTGGAAPVGSPPMILMAAEWLGLATFRSGGVTHQGRGDDLTALDVVPEPGTFVLATVGLLAGGVVAVARRRRRRKTT